MPCIKVALNHSQPQCGEEIVDANTNPTSAQHTDKSVAFVTSLTISHGYIAVDRLPTNRRTHEVAWSNATTNLKVHDMQHNETATNSTVEELQDLYIEPLLQVNGLKKFIAWFADLNTSGGQLCAEVSVLPSKIYESLLPILPLKNTNMTLTVYEGMPIQPNGICKLIRSIPGPVPDNVPVVDFNGVIKCKHYTIPTMQVIVLERQ